MASGNNGIDQRLHDNTLGVRANAGLCAKRHRVFRTQTERKT